MTYETVVDYISSVRRFGKAYGRDVTFEVMEHLEHPESNLKVIHIAGSNGKGSVAQFLASIISSGVKKNKPLKVGVFTSPHLVDFTERISINGENISKDDVARIGTYLINLPVSLPPTMFDYCLAIAIRYFAEKKCDYVILETGLGGAKDSTRGLLCTPLVSVITTISLEHTQILGNSVEEIAAEKAGIIRAKTRVVTGPLSDAAYRIINGRCVDLKVPILRTENLIDKSYELGLLGEHQRVNATIAVNAFKELVLATKDKSLQAVLDSDETMRCALNAARHPGRMEIVSEEPFMLLDGAHNEEGISALVESLKILYPGERFTFVMCVMKDKNCDDMLSKLSDICGKFIATTIDYDRAMSEEILCEKALKAGLDAVSVSNISTAIEKAKNSGNKVICAGSLYFIGELKKRVENNENRS